MNTNELIQRAETLLQQGDLDGAEKAYQNLCRMEHLTAEERGTALFGLGACLVVQEKWQTAAHHLHESLELLISSRGAEDILATRTMGLLARVLLTLGDLPTGMDVGRAALSNLEKLHGPDDEQVATTAFFLSSGAFQSGLLAEAEDLVSKALAVWEKIAGTESFQVASCLDALGRLRAVCGEHIEAAEFYRRSLNIKERVLGESESTAASAGQLGLSLASLQKWEEAGDALTRSLDMFSSVGADQDPQLLQIYRDKLELCRERIAKEADNGQERAD